MRLVYITFPEIPLRTRDGHKLRGFFGNLFKDNSPLLHNHFEDGSFRYGYPLVQYKVIDSIANLIGIGEGANLLVDLFLEIKTLNIDGKVYPVYSKNISAKKEEIKVGDDMYEYKFVTPWLALNQGNYRKYIDINNVEKENLLKSIFVGNILSFYKSINFTAESKIIVKLKLERTNVMFKGKKMTGFLGSFITNAYIPSYLGIGKSVSRGFGTLLQLD
jgi:hypothetical protein